jgi:polyisoprenoid-binding protein YceI
MRALVLALLAPIAAAALTLPAVAATLDIPSGPYVADPTHSSVTFKIGHFGLSFYTARFARLESAVTLDAADVARSAVKVAIDANSVRTDYPFPEKEDFDKKVGGDVNFLNGAAFPTISFVSKSIKLTGAKTALVSGDLTFRGVTRPVVLDAVLNGTLVSHPMRKVPMFGISGSTTIKRKDFGMTYLTGILGDEVTIMIEAEYLPAPK